MGRVPGRLLARMSAAGGPVLHWRQAAHCAPRWVLGTQLTVGRFVALHRVLFDHCQEALLRGPYPLAALVKPATGRRGAGEAGGRWGTRWRADGVQALMPEDNIRTRNHKQLTTTFSIRAAAAATAADSSCTHHHFPSGHSAAVHGTAVPFWYVTTVRLQRPPSTARACGEGGGAGAGER